MSVDPVSGVVLVLLAALVVLSVIELSVSLPSRLALRVLAEKDTHRQQAFLLSVGADRRRFLFPFQFGIQLILITIVLLVVWQQALGQGHPLVTLLLLVALVALGRQVIPRWLTRDPERFLIRMAPLAAILRPFLSVLSWPVLAAAGGLKRDSSDPDGPDEEPTEEEIQAYLGVGREEGLFEPGESRLIQSALEFGSTLVREIMTPRNEIAAIDDDATLGDLRDVIVSSKHSRIPVYRDRMDQIIGVVYVRNLLSTLSSGREAEPITPLIHEPLFVPETKLVADLLKEMQASAEHMAIVVNEYGAVSGLATIEDLLEEIVGEIHDEDETEQVDLIEEGNGVYLVRGGVEIEELEAALDHDFGDQDVTTVSGLIVTHLGHVPGVGDKIRLNGIEAEILGADERKVQTLRVRLVAEAEAEPGG